MYVTSTGNCCVVFDSYKQGPSIKDHKYERRIKKTSADMQVSEVNQVVFLSNERNKDQFILLQSRSLKSDAQVVHGDADTMIVTGAFIMAMEGKRAMW